MVGVVCVLPFKTDGFLPHILQAEAKIAAASLDKEYSPIGGSNEVRMLMTLNFLLAAACRTAGKAALLSRVHSACKFLKAIVGKGGREAAFLTIRITRPLSLEFVQIQRVLHPSPAYPRRGVFVFYRNRACLRFCVSSAEPRPLH
jgi:hypothetical protein